MPIKYNLTKYDLLSSKIKKLSAKKSQKEMTKEETLTMFKAVIIAAFTSGHSWKTYKEIISSSRQLHRAEIKEEFREAVTSKWRSISSFDIGELSNTAMSENVFFEWLFFNVDKEYHDDYKTAWDELQLEFAEDCDGAEVVREKFKQ